MLLLTLKQEEEVFMSNEVRVKILTIDEYSVTLGFEAPKFVNIVRAEVIAREVEESEYELTGDLFDHYLKSQMV